MRKKVSIAGVARRAVQEDKKVRDNIAKEAITSTAKDFPFPTKDSFQNFAYKMGVGADNALSTAGYGFNPITRNRVLLEWVHRGSWLGGVAIDVFADDMTRAGFILNGKMKPAEIQRMEEEAEKLHICSALNDNIKWARLYGGSIAVVMIDGQDYEKPLRIETIGKDQFKGLLVLDRWQVEPSLNDLVTEEGPHIGLPKFYRIAAEGPALPNIRIHYSRVIRLEGIRMSYWQRLQENLWGISVLERLYDRMVAFDSASTGAAQMVYKAFIRTYKIEGMRDVIAAGGDALTGLVQYAEMMRRFQGNEGITLMDKNDEFEGTATSAFGGLSEALTQFAQQLAGALQIPLVRLFGQSPGGFSTGDTDLRMYYDSIRQAQERDLRTGVIMVYRCIAQSLGIKLPDGFSITFRALWQLDQAKKAEVANTTVDAITKAHEVGLISDKIAMQELQQSSVETGIFSNITDMDINNADIELGVPNAESLLEASSKVEVAKIKAKAQTDKPDPNARLKAKDANTQDDLPVISQMCFKYNLQIVIENPKHSQRKGNGWVCVIPEDYGYIRSYTGADGDQMDCYVGNDLNLSYVWVINQWDIDKNRFDEHKVMIGFETEEEAKLTYLKGFSDDKGYLRLASMYMVPIYKFKEWLETGNLTIAYKPQ